MNKKQLVWLAVTFVILPLISLPATFFIGAFCLVNTFENLKNKEFYINLLKIICPMLFILGIYYCYNLAPSKANMDELYKDYWVDGFWFFSIKDFARIIVLNLKYYFFPNLSTLPQIMLLFLGAFWAIKDRNRLEKNALLVTGMVLIASLLNVYPLIGRVGLYFFPIVLLFIILPFDKIELSGAKSVIYTLIVFLMLLWGFHDYNKDYFKNLTNYDLCVSYSPKSLMQQMKSKYIPQKDIIVCNSASIASYIFYSKVMDFNADKIVEIPVFYDNTKVFDFLNNLDKNQSYWFYMIKDYNKRNVYPYIFKWLENKNIKYSQNEKNSYLFYVEN